MSITIYCARCDEELDAPGGLLFDPPVEYPLQTTSVKRHICVDCWPFVKEAAGQIKNPAVSSAINLARNIVNQLLDEAEVPVDKRQAINDTCDKFVTRLLVEWRVGIIP